jgi:hypothetical protein
MIVILILFVPILMFATVLSVMFIPVISVLICEAVIVILCSFWPPEGETNWFGAWERAMEVRESRQKRIATTRNLNRRMLRNPFAVDAWVRAWHELQDPIRYVRRGPRHAQKVDMVRRAPQ